MTIAYTKVAILGATGPVGLYLARGLRERGLRIRAVARNAKKLQRLYHAADVERCQADLTKREPAARALDGCDLAFHCIGVPGRAMYQHRAAAHAVADALVGTGIRCVHVSSFWSYLPLQARILTETHPRTGGSPWMQDRRAAEDILQEVGAAVANLPDFYGPGVHSSTMQQALQRAAHGRAINWIGNSTIPRGYGYLPDLARLLIALVEHDEVFGHRWLLPTAGEISGDGVARLASESLATHVDIHGASLRTLNLFSFINPPLRQYKQLIGQYVQPLQYDTRKLERLLGPLTVTPYAEGIRQTLAWLRAEAGE